MHKLDKADLVNISKPTIIFGVTGLANYSSSMALVVMSSKVVKAMAKLQSWSAISLSPQVGLLNWSGVHHYLGRVVLVGDG